MIFLQLFYTFFKIGLFGFGGGYAMISMIQGEVVTRHEWLSSNEFTDIIAISQMTPGRSESTPPPMWVIQLLSMQDILMQ